MVDNWLGLDGRNVPARNVSVRTKFKQIKQIT